MSDNVERLIKELRKNDLSLRRKKEILNLLQTMYEAADLEKETIGDEALGYDFFATTKSLLLDGSALPPFTIDRANLLDLLLRLENYGLLEQQLINDRGLKTIDLIMHDGDEPPEPCGIALGAVAVGIAAYREWENAVEIWGEKEREEQLSYLNAITDVIVDYTEMALARLEESDESLVYRQGGSTDSLGVRADMRTMIQSSPSMKNLGMRYHKALEEGFDNNPDLNWPVTVLNALLRLSRPTSMPLESQKAKGIQAISQTNASEWERLPALFLTMEDAQESTPELLIESIKLAYKEHGGIRQQFDKGLYIRTCPASPRPGALENRTVHGPAAMVQAIRELTDGMLDEESPFYDPDGCLCIMPKINSLCSMVMPTGHTTLTVGPSHYTVTAAAGSNLVISLNPSFAETLHYNVENMDIDDGLENHELEMVWPYSGHKFQTPKSVYGRSQVSGGSYVSMPYLVQVRGLHGDKTEVSEAPSVTHEGEIIFAVRGNVPSGHVTQWHSMNVGKGTLEDCLLLEQLIERDEIPEGFVIYVPSGTDHCHAAGVALAAKLPIVYGRSDEWDGSIWVEVKPGWVVCLPEHSDMEAIESNPYQPAHYAEYFKMGYEDGDRWWQYQNIALSQFFHEHMQGAKQDPRLVAYLAGAYGAWLSKATLAVAMGEARHAYLGQNQLFGPKHGLIHLLGTTFLGGHFAGSEEGVQFIGEFDYQGRNDYYDTLLNREVGVDNILTLLRGYYTLFDECEWSDSYGGAKYAKTMGLAIDFAEKYNRFLEEEDSHLKDRRYRSMLVAMNELESAQHNTGWFFNKFTTKLFMDVGTDGHKNLNNIPQQFIIAAAHQHRFYRRMGETEKIWDGYLSDKEWKEHSVYPRTTKMLYTDDLRVLFGTLMEELIYLDEDDNLMDVFLLDERDVVQSAIESMQKDPYCSDCDSNDCGCMATRRYHQKGFCASPTCSSQRCIQHTLVRTHRITVGVLLDWAYATQSICLKEDMDEAVGRRTHPYLKPSGWWHSGNPEMNPDTLPDQQFAPGEESCKRLISELNAYSGSINPQYYDSNATIFTGLVEEPRLVEDVNNHASYAGSIPLIGWQGDNEISLVSVSEHLKERLTLATKKGRVVKDDDDDWNEAVCDVYEEIHSTRAVREAWEKTETLFCIDGLVYDLRLMALKAVNSMTTEEYNELLFLLGDASKEWMSYGNGYLPPRLQQLYRFPTMDMTEECLTLLRHCARFGQAVHDISHGGGFFVQRTTSVGTRVVTEPQDWYVPSQVDSPVCVMVTFHALLIRAGPESNTLRSRPVRDAAHYYSKGHELDALVDINYMDSYAETWLQSATKKDTKHIFLQLIARRNKNEEKDE